MKLHQFFSFTRLFSRMKSVYTFISEPALRRQNAIFPMDF
jgi:hypothetical protein